MKNLVFSMLAMAAMVSCTSESDPIDEIKGDKVEIKLTAGVIETKAAITPNAANFATKTTVPLIRLDVDGEDGIRTWNSATTENAEITIDKVVLGSQNKYYEANGKYTYFIGYYPAGTFTSGVVSYTGQTGAEDIICTNETSVGSKTAPATNPNLEFLHMLSQVNIEVKGDAAAKAAFGKITKITLLDIPSSLDLTINAAPSIKANATPANAPIVIYEDATGKDLAPTSTTIGEIPMVVPGIGDTGKELKLEIVTEKGGTSSVTVGVISSGLQAGMKHVIKLDFKEKISVTASIKAWENGNEGLGSVD